MRRERTSEITKFEIRNILLSTHKKFGHERERVLTNREGWWRHPVEGNREEGRERGDCEIEGCKCERE